MTPISEVYLADKIIQILMLQLADNRLNWTLQSDGTYIKVPTIGKAINNHEILESYTNKIHNKSKKETPDYVNRLAKRILKEN